MRANSLGGSRPRQLTGRCIYCGRPGETKEHVPPRALLDKPYPDAPPVVAACQQCNGGYSKDEEYVACVLEAVVCGSARPGDQRRDSVRNALRHSPKLQHLIDSAQEATLFGPPVWRPDKARLDRVFAKIARGHIAFHTGWHIQYDTKPDIWFGPDELTEGLVPGVRLLLDVGTPGLTAALLYPDSRKRWRPNDAGRICVQKERYEYEYAPPCSVEMLIEDYLHVAVSWDESDVIGIDSDHEWFEWSWDDDEAALALEKAPRQPN